MNQTELNPCPWCGGLNLLVRFGAQDEEGVPSHIRCDDCGSSGPSEYVPEEVSAVCDATDSLPMRLVQLWNSRPKNRQKQRQAMDHHRQMLAMFANSAMNGMLFGCDPTDLSDNYVEDMVETAWHIANRMLEVSEEIFSED